MAEAEFDDVNDDELRNVHPTGDVGGEIVHPRHTGRKN